MTDTQITLTPEAHQLLLHLVTCPDLADNLQTLHTLALYESGDALLGREEKEALLNIRELALRLGMLNEADKKSLISILPFQ